MTFCVVLDRPEIISEKTTLLTNYLSERLQTHLLSKTQTAKSVAHALFNNSRAAEMKAERTKLKHALAKMVHSKKVTIPAELMTAESTGEDLFGFTDQKGVDEGPSATAAEA